MPNTGWDHRGAREQIITQSEAGPEGAKVARLSPIISMTHCEMLDLSLPPLTVLIEYIKVTIFNLKLRRLCNLNMEIPRGLCNQES